MTDFRQKKISRAGIELIKSFEGLRTAAVLLPDGRWTIGYSHTFSAREGGVATAEDAESLLRFDLLPIMDAVNSGIHVPLTQNQFDALVSFCFNIGVENFAQSNVLKRLNEGRYNEAAQAMDSWRCAEYNGQTYVLAPLIRRRAVEKSLFLTPDEVAQAPLTGVMRPLDETANVPVLDDFPTAMPSSVPGSSVSGASVSGSAHSEVGLSPEHLRQLYELTGGQTPKSAPSVAPPVLTGGFVPAGGIALAADNSGYEAYLAAEAEKQKRAEDARAKEEALRQQEVLRQQEAQRLARLNEALERENRLKAELEAIQAEREALLRPSEPEPKTLPETAPVAMAVPESAPVAAPVVIPVALAPMFASAVGSSLTASSVVSQSVPSTAPSVTPIQPDPEIARLEAARHEAFRLEAQRQEWLRQETLREEAEKLEVARLEAERLEAIRQEQLRQEQILQAQEAARLEVARLEQERHEQERLELERQELARLEAARLEAARLEAARLEAEHLETLRQEALRQEQARQEAQRQEAERQEQIRQELARQEAQRQEAEARRQQEEARLEAERLETQRQEALRQEDQDAKTPDEATRKAEAAAALMRFYSPYASASPIAARPAQSPAQSPAQTPIASPEPAPQPVEPPKVEPFSSPFNQNQTARSFNSGVQPETRETGAAQVETQTPAVRPELFNPYASNAVLMGGASLSGGSLIPQKREDSPVLVTPPVSAPSQSPSLHHALATPLSEETEADSAPEAAPGVGYVPDFEYDFTPGSPSSLPAPVIMAPVPKKPAFSEPSKAPEPSIDRVESRPHITTPPKPVTDFGSSEFAVPLSQSDDFFNRPSQYAPRAASITDAQNELDFSHQAVENFEASEDPGLWRTLVNTAQWIIGGGLGVAFLAAAFAAFTKMNNDTSQGMMMTDFKPLALITGGAGLILFLVSSFFIMRRLKQIKEKR